MTVLAFITPSFSNEYTYFHLKHQFPADLHLQNADLIYSCRMQFAIFNLIKLQAAAETTPSTCCSSHLLDIWFFRKSLRKLFFSHPIWFLPHSTIMWLQKAQLIQHRETADSWLKSVRCNPNLCAQPWICFTKSTCFEPNSLSRLHLPPKSC